MTISFHFNFEKTIAAVGYLAELEHGELDMFLSVKMLYLADKTALQTWGNTITGDRFVSMPKGPVLSKVYNLFKGTGTQAELARWSKTFGETVNNKIRLLTKAETDQLSLEEMEVLDRARNEVKSCAPWDVADWLHESCPEWQDPHGSSVRIDPAVILRNAGRTEQEIQMIEESIFVNNQLDDMLSHL